jgi:hypothetical protein
MAMRRNSVVAFFIPKRRSCLEANVFIFFETSSSVEVKKSYRPPFCVDFRLSLTVLLFITPVMEKMTIMLMVVTNLCATQKSG